MEEIDNSAQQDANIEDSSAPQEMEADQQSQSDVSAQDVSQETESAPERVPFNEDPAIQDYLARQERKLEERMQAQYEQAMQQLQSQFQPRQQEAPKGNPLLDRLKGIDPEFGSEFESVVQLKDELKQLKEWKAQQERQSILNQYESEVSKLHSQNQVPENLQSRVRKLLDIEVQRNPKLGFKDLPQVYKQIYEEEKNFIDSLKRQERASYVQDKSKDAKVPVSQPKGKVPNRDEKGRFASMDREERIAALSQEFAKQSRAEGDI